MAVQIESVQQLHQRLLIQAGGVEIDGLFGFGHLADYPFVSYGPSDAQPGNDSLGEGAGIDNRTAGGLPGEGH
ncbi:hypothetical protein D3C71_2029530 [compost metagenome]